MIVDARLLCHLLDQTILKIKLIGSQPVRLTLIPELIPESKSQVNGDDVMVYNLDDCEWQKFSLENVENVELEELDREGHI